MTAHSLQNGSRQLSQQVFFELEVMIDKKKKYYNVPIS